MHDVYLYVGEEKKNKVVSIDGQWDVILPTLTEAKGLPPGKLFDILLEGEFDLGSDGKTYSLRSEGGDWRQSVSPLKTVSGKEATIFQAFFGR